MKFFHMKFENKKLKISDKRAFKIIKKTSLGTTKQYPPATQLSKRRIPSHVNNTALLSAMHLLFIF